MEELRLRGDVNTGECLYALHDVLKIKVYAPIRIPIYVQ